MKVECKDNIRLSLEDIYRKFMCKKIRSKIRWYI